MNSFLLDTHLWLWWLQGSDRAPGELMDIVVDPANSVLVSSISLWEAVVKSQIGKLDSSADLRLATENSHIGFIPFEARDAERVASLPLHHRDPFDRALVAQAARRNLTLLTADRALAAYSDCANIRYAS